MEEYNKENKFCQGCSNIKELVQEKFKEMNNNIQQLQDNIQQLQDIVVKQNEIIITCLAEQKELAEKVLQQENARKNLRSEFPIKSIDGLNAINQRISEENQEHYVNMMKSLLKGRLPKTFTDVISTNVCMEINIEGVHGKTRLKSFQAFFQALTDACRSLGSNYPEKDIRYALKLITKRQIHAQCIKNKRKK